MLYRTAITVALVCLCLCAQVGTAQDNNDPWESKSLVATDYRHLPEVAKVTKMARVWTFSIRGGSVLSDDAVSELRRLRPSAVYRTELALSRRKEGREVDVWAKYEVRRYGRLLLGYELDENGEAAEAPSQIGFDSAGTSAKDMDAFYRTLETGRSETTRSQLLKLLKLFPNDFELWYRLACLEHNAGNNEAVARARREAKTNIVAAERHFRDEYNYVRSVAPISRMGVVTSWLGSVVQGRLLDKDLTLLFEASSVNQQRTSQRRKSDFVNSIGMGFVLIQLGEFLMGSPDSDDNAAFARSKPQHRVRITKPFYLGQTEVTQEQYERVMGANPSHFKGTPHRPVENISWEEATQFCQKLSEKEGRKYRLPTEAEWEYACRAGSQKRYHFGDDPAVIGEYAWFGNSLYVRSSIRGNSRKTTHSVGEKKPNAWGLYDMHGNVWEWCHDWYGGYEQTQMEDPKGPPTGSGRVVRGGSWEGGVRIQCSATRYSAKPGRRSYDLGFRVVRVRPVDETER